MVFDRCNLPGSWVVLGVLVSAGVIIMVWPANGLAQTDYPDLGITAETIIHDLNIPWEVQFASDDIAFITTRGGTAYVYHDDILQPILDLNVGGGEGGMLGIAIHPEYESNGMVYVYHTDLELDNIVIRYIHQNNRLIYHDTIVQDIPASQYHNGGRIAFGPDGKLYVTTGDAGNAPLSRDISTLAGKILRVEPDGAIPEDNPFAGSPVYAYGLRNSQGIAWSSDGTMFVTDHGPSGFFDRAHDEINLIVAGGDYGWPESIGDRVIPGTVGPFIESGDITWAPSDILYVHNSMIPQWNGALIYTALFGEHLGVIYEDESRQEILKGEFGRIRALTQHPDGSIYILTTNTDGRGTPSDIDDRLIRITAYPPIPAQITPIAERLWEFYRIGDIDMSVLQTALHYLSGNSDT